MAEMIQPEPGRSQHGNRLSCNRSRNRLNSLVVALLVMVSIFLSFSTVPQPALGANLPTNLLTLDDLPPGFAVYSGAAVGNCNPSEQPGNAFVSEAAIAEIVCVSSVPIDHIVENNQPGSPLGIAFLDAMLSNPEALTQVLGQEKPEDLQFLDLSGVGNIAIGFRGTVADLGKTDIAIFRRDATLNTVFVIHPDRATPLTSLQSLASKLDQRLQSFAS